MRKSVTNSRENLFVTVETNCMSHRALQDAERKRNDIIELLFVVRFIKYDVIFIMSSFRDG